MSGLFRVRACLGVACCIAALPLSSSLHAQSDGDAVDPRFVGIDPQQKIATTMTQPVAVRGSVLLLPIVRRSAQVEWPTSIELRLGDGRKLVGRVARIESREPTSELWTTPSRIIVAAPPVGDNDIALLVELPSDADDDIQLESQRVDPYWMNPLPPVLVEKEPPELLVNDLPDPAAPNEYFRTVLLAHRNSTVPSEPQGSDLEVLYARSQAALWSAAIARLEENDPVMSQMVISDLVGRAHTSGTPRTTSFAAWETDEADLTQLLRSLLTPKVDGIIIAESARAWLEGRSPLIFWIEKDDGESLVIGVANPRCVAIPLNLRWPDQSDTATTGDVAPESVQYFRVARTDWTSSHAPIIDPALADAMIERGLGGMLPPGDMAGPSAARTALERQARAAQVLIAQQSEISTNILVGRGRGATRPPGIGFGTFVPAANLAGIRSGVLRSPPAQWSTTMGLRKRPAGWELLVECRSPQGASPNRDEVIIVCDGGFQQTIKVRSDGSIDAQSELVESTAQIHHSADRWRVRIPLPDDWMAPLKGVPGKFSIAASRRVDGSGSDAPPPFARRQFAAFAPLSVDKRARSIPIDLSSWTLESVTLAP